MTELHPIHQAYSAAIAQDKPNAVIPLGQTVLCDDDSTDLTSDPRSGGFLFGSYAIGPCCADQYLARIRQYGEEHFIKAWCPEGVSFADWVRGMRGPDAAITVGPYRRQAGEQR
jgi:hypothetical protein